MAASPKRLYWDACTWIALIQKEKIRDENGVLVEDRETMCKSVTHAAESGAVEIVTSTLSLTEVCRIDEIKNAEEDVIANFFENEWILLANVDRAVGERGRELMRAGYSKLKPPDAIHLATAALANTDEMHTFDDRLLRLDKRVAKANGDPLPICKPDPGGPAMPLLKQSEARARGSADDG